MNPRELEQIGPYPVVEFIAEGGMAWVFKVQDPKFKVNRALKMLKPQAAQGEEFKRFESEAKLLARIEHPNLITIYDFGEDEATGCHYYTMTFVDGPALASTEKLPADLAVDIFSDVLSALARLHEQGIIHRDIKPANILMMSDGRALLGDLGIARQQDQMFSLTRTGMAIGSVQYMSPEQARGHSVTTASDVFSIGLSLYQVLTGRTIYDVVDEVDATSGEQVLMYLGALIHSGSELRFDFPPDIPKPLQRVIETSCRFDPAQRYPDASAQRQALIAAMQETEQTDETRRRWIRRGAAGAALALLVALLVWLLTPGSGPALPEYYASSLERLQSAGTTEAGKLLIIDQMGVDPGKHATTVLIAAAEDPAPRVAVESIKQLNQRMDDRVAAFLVSQLGDPEYTVRAWSARGLRENGRTEALPALEEALKTEQNSATRRSIERAIEGLSQASEPPPETGAGGEAGG